MRTLALIVSPILSFASACDSQKAEAPAPHTEAEHAHEHPQAAVPSPAALDGNPVQNEMRLLTEAMNKSLIIITNGDLKNLPPTIFAVHGARNETEKAIKEGRYKPPKNGHDIDGFMATDAAFHDQLVRMVKAANAGDRKEATAAYADVVIGCTNCHQQYREGF